MAAKRTTVTTVWLCPTQRVGLEKLWELVGTETSLCVSDIGWFFLFWGRIPSSPALLPGGRRAGDEGVRDKYQLNEENICPVFGLSHVTREVNHLSNG